MGEAPCLFSLGCNGLSAGEPFRDVCELVVDGDEDKDEDEIKASYEPRSRLRERLERRSSLPLSSLLSRHRRP